MPLVSGGDNQVVHARGGGNHRVFEEIVGPVFDQTTPLAKTGRIHREYIVVQRQGIQPDLEFTGLFRVLSPRTLDAGLQLTEGYGGEAKLCRVQAGNPGNYRAVESAIGGLIVLQSAL